MSAPVRSTAGLLIGLGAAFALLWLSIELPAAIAAEPPQELTDTGLVANPIHVLDLFLLPPALLAAGILLARRRPLGYALARTMLTVAAALTLGSVALTLVSARRGLDWSPAVLAGVTALGLAELAALARWRALARSPGADPAHPLDADDEPPAGRRVVHRREADVRAEVHVREPLQELRRAALLDARAAVDDEVLLQPGRLDLAALEGERHARVALDVP